MPRSKPPHRFNDIRQVASTGSTNSDVLTLGRDGAGEGIVVSADVQTAGRGRHDRSWVAPPGSGLLCSVLLRPPGRVVDLVTMMVAVAAADAAGSLGARGVGIKWPNDLVVDVSGGPTPGPGPAERKLAGILAEADWTLGTTIAGGYRPPGDTERVLVAAGLGMNLASVDGIPAGIADRRISLNELLGTAVDRETVLVRYLEALDERYSQLLVDRVGLLDAWRSACVTLGRYVRVDLGAEELSGRATAVDDSGRLAVVTESGRMRVVAAGDVVHLSALRGTTIGNRSRH